MKHEHMDDKIARFLGYRYPTTVVEMSPDDGGGFAAFIPQLGDRTFVAAGDTAEEAVTALDALRRDLIPRLLREGVELPMPEPPREAHGGFSGSLMLRVPPELHAALATAAKRNGCSVNKLATYYLASGLGRVSSDGEAMELASLVADEVVRKLQASPSGSAPGQKGGGWSREQSSSSSERTTLYVDEGYGNASQARVA